MTAPLFRGTSIATRALTLSSRAERGICFSLPLRRVPHPLALSFVGVTHTNSSVAQALLPVLFIPGGSL